MSRLIVIEGLDGAGKRTLADRLVASLAEQGAKVARLAFPRYGRSAPADLLRDALYGRAGDLSESVYGMAALFAMDRAGALGELRGALRAHDVVLLDRYVASNAAYGAARLHERAGGAFVRWVRELEIDRLGLPVPHVHVLLRVAPELAAERALGRERSDATRSRDAFEADAGLQARVAAVYDELATAGWLAPWTVLDGTGGVDVAALAAELTGLDRAAT